MICTYLMVNRYKVYEMRQNIMIMPIVSRLKTDYSQRSIPISNLPIRVFSQLDYNTVPDNMSNAYHIEIYYVLKLFYNICNLSSKKIKYDKRQLQLQNSVFTFQSH